MSSIGRRRFLESAGAVIALATAPKIAWPKIRLFEPHSEISVGCIRKFIAAENFCEGSTIGSRILRSMGWSFSKHFLVARESNVPEVRVHALALWYSASDRWILDTARGDGHTAVCFIAYIHRLMELGEDGPCHVDGRRNFSYAHPALDNGLWAIQWFVNNSGEWVVGAAVVPHPDIDWRSGSRLFTSRVNPEVAVCTAA